MSKRKNEFLIRMDDEEFKILNDAVARSGYSREQYVRSILFGRIPKDIPSQDFFDMVDQLRRIGNNINQLTLLAHRTNMIEYEELKKQLFYLNQSIGDIREEVLLPREIE